ncbi:hypothetical protein M422DRAFT_154434 [Sphaerobolus stellatus SS14]|nr:hypothetical protein M422DRAFT_154434 [Sphaerobolus stellatus SS14]
MVTAESLIFNEEFTPSTSALQNSVKYIRAIRKASLDNGDLSKEAVRRLRNPPQSALSITSQDEYSLKMFLATYDQPERVYRDLRIIHNEFYDDSLMHSYEDMQNRITEWTGIHPILADMCPNTCVAYTGPLADLNSCPECGKPRYDVVELEKSHGERKVPLRQFYTIPLGPQIQQQRRNPASSDAMNYRQRKMTELLQQLERADGVIESYEDLYDGMEFIQAVGRGDIRATDSMVLWSIDGAQLYRDKQSGCWIYIFILIDLDPSIRYKKKYVLPGGFIPGPNNPKNMESFLFPGFHHISALQKEGLCIWDGLTNSSYLSRIFFYLGTADGPGSVYFSGLVGHQGALSCRLFCGMKGRRKPGSSHYYPALLRPHNYQVSGCDHPDIDPRSLQAASQEIYDEKLIYVLQSTSQTNYEARRRDTGISIPSILLGFQPDCCLPVASAFVGDCMHVLTLNMGELFVPLWRGTFQCASTDDIDNWGFAVFRDTTIWTEHGAMIAAATPYIPGSFDRPPRDISLKLNSGYKAKEWQGYYYGLVPGLLYGILPEVYWTHFCKLVQAVRILHQYSIPRGQLLYAQQLIEDFCIDFEKLYIQGRADRLHFARPSLHYILHMCQEVPRIGPSPFTSTWTMERTIGNLGEEISLHSAPFANLSERGVKRAQYNALVAALPHLKKAENQPRGSLDIGNGYFMLTKMERSPKTYQGQVSEVIIQYIQGQEAAAGIQARNNITPRFTRWARLHLPNGQNARSAWRELEIERKGMDKIRCARCVKFSSEGKAHFGEVHFYFFMTIANQPVPLALVQTYSLPDEELLAKSSRTLYSVTQLREQEGLQVIKAKDIISVVSIQPHDFKRMAGEQRYFIWEQLGMGIGLLDEPREPLREEDLFEG